MGTPNKGVTVHAELFWLANAENETEVYAYGIEISNSGDLEAVTFRRDPSTGRFQFGTHDSAEAARTRFQRVLPLVLRYDRDVYEDDEEELAAVEP
jgi:cytochrome c-type biogenesis protein CcmE